MDLIVRAAVIYLAVFIIMRAAGNRQFSELTSFDAVMIIIMSEATQQALMGGQDFSITAALLIVVTFVGLDVLLSHIKQWSSRADTFIEGVPVLLVDDGELVRINMERERVDEDDILAAARLHQGLESLDQIRYAVLERGGAISVIPRQQRSAV